MDRAAPAAGDGGADRGHADNGKRLRKALGDQMRHPYITHQGLSPAPADQPDCEGDGPAGGASCGTDHVDHGDAEAG